MSSHPTEQDQRHICPYCGLITAEYTNGCPKNLRGDHPRVSMQLMTAKVKQTVTISAELSDAYVVLLRAAQQEGGDCVPRSEELTGAINAVIRAGGGK